MKSSTTVIFTGGPHRIADLRAATADLSPDLVIAADSGLTAAKSIGISVDVVVGDMDSVSAKDLQNCIDGGGHAVRYEEDKDATDLKLALDLALDPAPAPNRPTDSPWKLLIVGSRSGRLDHLLSWTQMVSAPRFGALANTCEVTAWMGATVLLPVFGTRVITGRPGSLISLIASHGTATGVNTSGLKWNLAEAELESFSSVGVSNRFVGDVAEISVRSGVVSVVIPEEET